MSDSFFQRIDSMGGDVQRTFRLLLEDISPMSLNPILALFNEYGNRYIEEARDFIEISRRRFSAPGEYEQSLEDFGEMVVQFARLSAVFQENMSYDSARPSGTDVETISGEDFYIKGLWWSYVFWFNHYNLRRFFHDKTLSAVRPGSDYLEIGPGHGLFIVDALRTGKMNRIVGCDRNSRAIAFAKDTLRRLELDDGRVSLISDNMASLSANHQFDLCVMAEVLEHVSSPGDLLRDAAAMIKPDGMIFVTTVTNVPFVDHIYQFRCIEEIREVVRAAGLTVTAERAERVFGAPERQAAYDYFAICNKITGRSARREK